MDDNKTIKDFEEDNKLNIEKVIETYNFYVYTILRNSISSEEDIQEILSDVFFIFWNKHKSLDDNLKVKPYLIGIVKNLIKKKYRDYRLNLGAKTYEKFENQNLLEVDITELAENNEKTQIISSFINSRRLQEKQVFILFYYQNETVANIAKKLNISIPKVKVTLHRLRNLIKRELKERGYNYGK